MGRRLKTFKLSYSLKYDTSLLRTMGSMLGCVLDFERLS